MYQFKILRHIEACRNFMNCFIKEIIVRQETHDQSKLEDPEVAIFSTVNLNGIPFGTVEYNDHLETLNGALDHHYACNRHHPEHHSNGINDMTLVDLVEMFCDWKASSLRNEKDNIYKSIEVCAKKFNMSPELKKIFINTAQWIDNEKIIHKAKEC